MIYFSFIGTHDQLRSTNEPGAFANICTKYGDKIAKVYVLVTNSNKSLDYSRFADDNITYLSVKFPKIKFHKVSIELNNPIDYGVVYSNMLNQVMSIIEENNLDEIEKLINISSGTPTMTSCWVLLAQSGILKKAQLVQSFEKKFADQNGETTREVSFNIDDFPKIEAPSAIKRKLTLVSRENKRLSESERNNFLDTTIPELVGESKSIREIKEQIIEDITPSTHVLILGERGTGKEVVAQAIWKRYHKHSDEKLSIIDCGTFQRELIASELFGHKKGSFTGAMTDKTGILSEHHDKMLFLDEIGNLPLDGQQNLLRVLSAGEYRRIGDNVSNKVSVQIIAATNKNVDDPTLFAQDIKDRFDVIVSLPALRDHKQDIPLLLKFFIDTYSRSEGVISPITLEESLINKLTIYNWPGNVRELEKWTKKIIHRFRAGGVIRLEDLPDNFITGIISESMPDVVLPELPLPIPLPEYTDLIIEKARNLANGKLVVVDKLLNQKVGTEKQRRSRDRNKSNNQNQQQ